MDNPLLSPNLGLVIWQTLVFLILIILLKKFAWKPILNAVKSREESIDGQLKAAEAAKEEMAGLQSQNEALLKEAREERDTMLKEARDIRDKMVSDAKGLASNEAEKMIEAARETIEGEKVAAIAELKSHVASISIEIAEKIVKDQLSSDDKQKALVNQLIEEVSQN